MNGYSHLPNRHCISHDWFIQMSLSMDKSKQAQTFLVQSPTQGHGNASVPRASPGMGRCQICLHHTQRNPDAAGGGYPHSTPASTLPPYIILVGYVFLCVHFRYVNSSLTCHFEDFAITRFHPTVALCTELD